MKEYLCVEPYPHFTVGRVYKTSSHGGLIDDDGDSRFRINPEEFPWSALFVPCEVEIENK